MASEGVRGSGLRIVYRSYAGENLKDRPAYYSKDVALTSFVRAVQALDVPPEVIFLNDGDLPAGRLDVMRQVGELVPVRCGSNLASYRTALRLALDRGWPDDDVLWLAEDDYLYRPDALQVLMSGVRTVPDGDYFSLYSPWDTEPPAAGSGDPRTEAARHALTPAGSRGSEGAGWVRALSTTSTFAVRLSALRTDHRLLHLCAHSGGAWDHTTCLAVQGIRPFAWAQLRRELAAATSQPPAGWARTGARVAVRVVLNLRATRRRRNRRRLYAARSLPIWHLENPEQPGPGSTQTWEALAGRTLAWALDAGPAQPESAGRPARTALRRLLAPTS